MKNQKHKRQSGFTMIEMVVVLIVIGILMIIALPGAKDATNPAKASGLLRAADQITSNLKMAAAKCGISTTIAGNPLPDTGKTLSDVLFGGVANVAAQYKPCYNASAAIVLAEVGQPSATAGVYEVYGHALSLSGGGTSPVKLGFDGVSDEIGLNVAQNYNPALSELATSDTTSPVVQYDSASGGVRKLYILKR